jgi:uncharacterized protein YoxC
MEVLLLEEKDYITNKAKLSSLTNTYSENDSDSKGLFKRKADPLKTFGDSQNEFNKNVVKSFDDTSDSLEEINKKLLSLETKLTAVVQQNDALKTRINKLQQGEVAILDGCINSIQKTNKDLNDYIRSVNPEKRKAVSSLSECKEVNEMIYVELSNDESLKSKDSVTLEEWGKVYKNTLKQQLLGMGVSYAKKIIAIVCKGFLLDVNSTNREAFWLYMTLKKSSNYNLKFITIEPMLTRPVMNYDVICLPEKGFGQYLDTINPRVCVFCDTSLDIATVDNGSALKYRSIFKLNGQTPLNGLDEDTISQLKYLNDLGLHSYLVQTKKASDSLVENGFHEPTVALPTVNGNRLYTKTRTFNKDNFTVGFETSPSDSELLEANGVNLLCELVQSMEDTNFEIVWKYKKVPVPETLSNAKNCNISVGMQDKKHTEEFFTKIDCLLVPSTTDVNMAYPMAGLEALKNAIPVVSTEFCGLSEIVSYCAMGEITSPDSESLKSAMEKVRDNYSQYTDYINILRLNDKLDSYHIVDYIESFTEDSYRVNPITLKAWGETLKKSKKSLLTSNEDISTFCKDVPNFKKYLETKYTPDVLKCLDYIILQNVSSIIEDRFENAKLQLLDVSFGDTSVSTECAKHGECEKSNLLTADVDGTYNVITCFRYLSYLNYADRKAVYKKIFEHLSENGVAIIDVPNIAVDVPLKNTIGWQNFNVCETAWTKQSIVDELENNGFKVQYIIPVGQSLLTNVDENTKKLPVSWTVGVLKTLKA